MKNKYLISYPVVGIISALVCFLPLILTNACPLLEIIFFSAAAGAVGILIARIILHETDEDNSLKTWQVTIYFALSIGGWICACLSQTWTWASIWLCVTMCGIILALGTRYLKDVNGDGIPDIFQDKKDVYSVDFLKANLRFRFVDDKLGGKKDTSKPLCLVDGKTMTVNEAMTAGYMDVANQGIEYIRTLYK